jgi:hypothetical protein
VNGRFPATLLLVACAVVAVAAAATEPATFAGACAELPDGAPVRLARLDGATIEGLVAGWDGSRLQLVLPDGAAADCREDETAALWVRQVRTVGGLKLGGLLGGAASGLGMAVLLAVFSTADDDGLGDAVGPLMLISVGAGAGIGALVGGIAGSSLPAWDLRWARPGWSAEPDRARAGSELHTGGLELLLGTASARGWPEQDGMASGLRWRATLTPRWSAALEIARFRAEPRHPFENDLSEHRDYSDDCRHAGALLQFNLTTDDLRPYLVGGLGGYWWDENFLGGCWGGGLEGDVGRHAMGRLEYRRHGNIQRLVGSDPGLESVQIGVGWAW